MQASGFSPAPPRALSVTQLVDRIKNAIRITIGHQWVEGEISNLRIQSSGHAYFTLKDAGAQISCVFFKQRSAGCKVNLREGIKVIAYGEATVYEQRGQMQLVLSKIEPAGLGDLQQKFLELKARLESEGLFSQGRKKAIPSFPRSIGLITSPTGAAIQDIRHVLEKRAPWISVHLYPVLVQGPGAAPQIANAIAAWSNAAPNGLPPVDTLIIARGGGSIEDLWAFNEEIVARAIAACPIPVIAGIGHETDFTIADFVADLRAPTPTGAAMAATPDGTDLIRRIDALGQSLTGRARRLLEHSRLRLSCIERSDLGSPHVFFEGFQQQLDECEADLFAGANNLVSDKSGLLERMELMLKSRHPRILNEQRSRQLDALEARLRHSVRQKLSTIPSRLELLALRLTERTRGKMEESTAKISLLESKLETRSPLQTLERGYALVRNPEGRIITSPADTKTGELLDITVRGGKITAKTEPSRP